MREIKFKAWHKEDGRFIDLNGFEIAFKGMRKQGCVTDVIEQCNLTMISVDDVELMQYTGLKDKNGVEIYEGDIVEHDHSIYGVYYDEADAAFALAIDEYQEIRLCEISNSLIEKIGNIYENPELLENKND